MPKVRTSCRTCAWFQGADGLRIGLCWRGHNGPEILGPPCGGCEAHQERTELSLTPWQMWRTLHGKIEYELTEVLTLLNLASCRRLGREAEPVSHSEEAWGR